MIGRRTISLLTATIFVAALPASVSAQDTGPTPEGIEWTLTSYLDDTAELVTVPAGIRATLLLEDGIASGSGGCNQFSGSYQLENLSLTFGEEFSQTLRFCEDEPQAVEDAYLPQLPRTESWDIVDGRLELSDGFGDTILTFTEGGTAAELVALRALVEELRAEIDRVNQRVTNANIPRIRERLRTLESENERLREQIRDLQRPRPQPTATPAPSGFTRTERTLLRAIPPRIANRCATPADDGLLIPGIVAGLDCRPNTTAVNVMSYYLLESSDARDLFDSATPDGLPALGRGITCRSGIRGYQLYQDVGNQRESCFVQRGRPMVVYVENATNCRVLRVGRRTLRNPAIVIIIDTDDTGRAASWATRDLTLGTSGRITSIATPIPSDGRRITTGCFS